EIAADANVLSSGSDILSVGTLNSNAGTDLNLQSEILVSAGTVAGNIVLAGGIFAVDQSLTVSGSISHTASSSINVSGGKILTYTGAAVDLGALTLTLPGAGTVTNTNAFNLNDAASVLKIDGAGSTIQGPVALAGGTLDVDENTTINGAVTHTAGSTIDVAMGKTLTYGGTAIDLDAFTLTLPGAGTLANTNAVNLNHVASILKIDGLNGIIQGPIDLGGGTLDVNGNTSLNGALTHSASSSVDVATSKILTYGGAAVDLDAFTLSLSGNGKINNTNALNLNNVGSTLMIDGLDFEIQGAVEFGGGTLDTDQNAAISGLITLTSNSTINVAEGTTLTYSNATPVSVDTGNSLTFSEKGTFAGSIKLFGGTLDINEDMTISGAGNITNTASSTIDIAANKTLTYLGASVSINGYDLNITSGNSSSISNANPFVLNNGDSRLNVADSDSGSINKVSVTVASNGGKGIEVSSTGTYTIVDLSLSVTAAGDARITTTAGTLVIGNSTTVTSGADVNLVVSGAGTLTLGDVVLFGDLDIDGTVSLTNDATLTAMETVTFGPGSDMEFKDGIYVASGKVLTINDTDDVGVTLTISGGFTLDGTLTLAGDENLTLQNPTPDADVLAQITKSGSGTLIPLQPITGFAASDAGTGGTIDLDWSNLGGIEVLICRSTVGYWTSPCTLDGPDEVYDDVVGVSTTDSALTDGVTYYYTAFSHDIADTNYTAPQTTSATPSNSTPTVSDVVGFTATPADGMVTLSWSPPDPAGDYTAVKILRKESGYPTSESDGTVIYDGAASPQNDTTAVNGTVYYYRAYGHDSGSTSFSYGTNAVAAAAMVPSGLVSYYPLKGNNSDGSGQGNHGTLTASDASNDTYDMLGNWAYAYVLDDTGESIEIDNPVEDDFSISFWIKSIQTSGVGNNNNWYSGVGLVEGHDGTSQNDFGLTLGDAGEILFGVGLPDASDEKLVSSAINDGEWYNVTATRDKNLGTISLYIQGEEIATSSSAGTQSLSSPTLLQIGHESLNGTGSFNGSLDEIRIYNRVLTATEIQKLYFSTVSKVEANISAGDYHTCLLLSSGVIDCWGDTGAMGRLGNGSTSGATPTPAAVTGISTAMQVSSGPNHSCAVLRNNTIQCWGEGANGKLGNGATNDATTPVSVNNVSTAVQVSVGGEHSCALLDNGWNGTIRCWGDPSQGQIGNNTTSGSYYEPSEATAVSNISTAVQIGSGLDFSCALMANGTVRCWGNGANGRLGNGSTDSQSTPVVVSGISTATQLTVGSAHACALMADRTIKCWGEGSASSDGTTMGNGTDLDTNSTPVAVSDISNAIQVSAGKSHTCALLNDNTMKCWGNGNMGQLGNTALNSEELSPVVVDVNGDEIDNAVHIATGEEFTCTVLSDGTAKCWGEGSSGQLGSGTSDSSNPLSVGSISTAKQ
ncbi:MAG: hypothetical protein GY866_42890, partial [Proteobacteria bacterium]|nr:hypothetical protein [Pseudomonadota bacterium]